ncbi:MAG: leucine-rich repeat domain-containing protein [Clostridiales bacterium]|nr:leucine-rich repeat domain-containing protein [Clostridiales bacterium]
MSLLILLPSRTVLAAGSSAPTASNNLNVGLKRTSDLVSTDSGYMRVYYNGTNVGVEWYDSSFNLESKKSIAMELSLWGGFYAGKDAYYLVEGQNNTEEDDNAEVIRVIKYDTKWERIGAASITSNPDLFGGEVRYPFNSGCVEFTETNGNLYIVTGHQGYVDASVGQGHQGFLMIKVDTASMTGKIVKCDLWHSFAQYVQASDTDLYILEQSEGSRCTTLKKYNTETSESTTVSVLDYGGSRTSAWAIACYASVDGMALSDDNVLCIGTSIDQSQYESVSSSTSHNIYLTVTPKLDFSEEATTVKWLTDYNGDGKSFLGVNITRISGNRFMVSWEESDTASTASTDDCLSGSTLHYVFIDGNGNKISKEYKQSMPVSDCQPIVNGSEVVYYASNENMVNFYSINSSTGSASKKVYRVAGENATWDFKNGVLTISGTGAMSVDTEAGVRYALSSTSSYYVYSSSDNAWKSIRDQVEKIVIKEGITSIPEKAFAYFSKVEEVEIGSGLKSIGEKAFYSCDSLRKITIPSSVNTIGDDILWTGSSWLGSGKHVVYATIYAPYGSYAVKYAKKNGIGYCMNLSESGAKISGVKASYVYNGKSKKPSVTVKIGDKALKKDTDYKVSYKNNKEIGTATVKVTGINNYYGTLTRSFKITLPAKGTKLTDSETKNTYVITKAGDSVALSGTKDKTKTTLSVPSTVAINGVTYKVTSIANNAFKNNTKLTKVTISGNVTKIGEGAFRGCTALRTVKIGTTVKYIGAKAFYGCTALKTLTIKSVKLTSVTVGDKAFTGAGKSNYKKLTVNTPEKKRAAYKKLLKKKGLSSKATIL